MERELFKAVAGMAIVVCTMVAMYNLLFIMICK
jgi:hypothetical protein